MKKTESPGRLRSFYRRHREDVNSYLIIGVPLIWWGIFFVYPFLQTIFVSFTDWSLAPEVNWIWMDNYVRMFQDQEVLRSFLNTLIWSVVMLIGNNFFGLLMAFLLTNMNKPKLERFFLALLYWPSLVSAVVGASMQILVFSSANTGIMNTILLGLHWIDEPIKWLQDPSIALLSMMIIPFFFGFPMKMLLFYIGIKGIPESYREVASLETDSKFKQLRYIILPLLQPVVFLNVVLSMIDGFKVIAPMQLIGEMMYVPKFETDSVVLKLYETAFKGKSEFGYACAISMVLFVVTLLVTLVQKKFEGERVEYE